VVHLAGTSSDGRLIEDVAQRPGVDASLAQPVSRTSNSIRSVAMMSSGLPLHQ